MTLSQLADSARLRRAGRRSLGRIERLPVFTALLVVITAVMGFLILYPLGSIVYHVFIDKDAFGASYSLGDTFGNPALGRALLNTLLLTLVAGSFSLLVGATLAWLNERTDARLGWAADALPIVPLMVPHLATAIGWVFLLSPRTGYLNIAFRELFGAGDPLTGEGPLDIYSVAGIIWVTIVVTVPLAYLTVSAALRNIDPSLEEASRMNGAGAIRTLVKVTLPALRNALAAAGVLVVVVCISMFSVPVILGGSAGIDVLSTLIFRLLYAEGGIPNFGEAMILSLFMLLIVQAVILIEHAIMRKGRHATISGSARASSAMTELGIWRIPARAFMTAYFLCATVLPMAALIVVSLQPFWSATVKWDVLSFDNYRDMFGPNNQLGQAFLNSLILGITCATILMVVAAIVAYYAATAPGPLARLVNAASVMPASVPHVVIGVAFLVTLGTGKYSLSGSLLLLLLAYLFINLPQATRSSGSAMSQVGRTLWEGSVMAGSSPIRTFVRIVLPLMGAGLLAGWVIVFTGAFSEVTASIFLATPANPVSGQAIVDVWSHSGTYPQLAALAVSVAVAQTTVVLVVRMLVPLLSKRQRRLRRPRAVFEAGAFDQ